MHTLESVLHQGEGNEAVVIVYVWMIRENVRI